MSNDIKPIYQDKSGNTHDTRAAAKKANRVVDAANGLASALADCEVDHFAGLLGADLLDDKSGHFFRVDAIEYARAVVAIYGMKDKAPHNEVPK